jgi:uncharacterized protein (DUF58 family)
VRGAAGTAALGGLLTLVAFAFDAEPLLAAGPALVVLALAGAAWVRLAARGASLERRLDARRVVEGEPLTVRLRARSGALPFPGGAVSDPLLPAPAPLRPGGASTRVRLEVRFARRGWRTLAPPSLEVADPFGLAARGVGAQESDGAAARVLVLPRTFPLSAAPSGGTEALTPGPRALLSAGAEVEVDGLRPYRTGAPAARIHWPALARGAGLLERRLRPEADTRPLVVLDTDGDEEAVDAAVRAAGSLALALAPASGCDLLLPGARVPATLDAALRSWPVLHARLAVVPAGLRPAGLGSAARSAPVVYVAARRLGGAPRGLVGGGPRMLVTPASLAPAGRPVFAVAGCIGVELARSGARPEAA